MYLRRVSEQERDKHADSLVNLAIAAGQSTNLARQNTD
jgi:hypothetical protein